MELTNELQQIDGGSGFFESQKKTSTIDSFFKKATVTEVTKPEPIKTSEELKQAEPNTTTVNKDNPFPFEKTAPKQQQPPVNQMSQENAEKLALLYAKLDIESIDFGFGSLTQLIFLKADKDEITKEFTLNKARRDQLSDLLFEIYKIKGIQSKNPTFQFWKAIVISYVPLIIGVIRRLINPPVVVSEADKNKQITEVEKLKKENAFLRAKMNAKTVDAEEIPAEEKKPEEKEETETKEVNKGTFTVITKETRGRKKGAKKNPKTGKMEYPNENGFYSWQKSKK